MIRNPRLNDLRRRLLSKGLPLEEVRLYIRELRDHLEDLVEEGVTSGLSLPEATTSAEQRLGAIVQLADAEIRRFRRSTCVGRHPVLCFGVAPLVGLLLTWLVVLILLYVSVDRLASQFPQCREISIAWAPTGAFVLSCLVPCSLAIIFYRAARKRAQPTLWRVYPCLFLALGAAFMKLSVVTGTPTTLGRVLLGMDGHPDLVLALLPLAATALWAKFVTPRHLRSVA